MTAMEARKLADELDDQIAALNRAVGVLDEADFIHEARTVQAIYYVYRDKLAELELRMESAQV